MSDTQTKPTDWKGLIALALLRLVGSLPLGLNRAFGGCLGRLGHRLGASSSRITRINIELCYPQLSAPEREQLIAQSSYETGRLGTEMPAIWFKSDDWLHQRLVGEVNRELLDKRVAEAPGLIVLVPHLGNWEVFGPYMSRVTPLTALYQPPKLPALEKLVVSARERWGATLVPTNRRGVAQLLKSLKAGGGTLIFPDQVPDAAGGEYAPFFGVPALTMTLVHNLIQRTGCRVVMAYALREADGFKVVFEEPQAAIYSADTATALAAMNRSVEACVSACPSQYQWEYKRFKKQPPGVPVPYAKS